MRTAELNSLKYSMMEELMSINNPDVLGKICAYIRQLKRAEKIKGSAQFKEELRADLKEALREVEDVKNGKSQFMSMNELYAELEETK